MDAISQKKVDILKAFTSLVDGGSDVAPFLSSNVKMMHDCCYDDNAAVVECAVQLLHKLAAVGKYRQTLLAHGSLRVLDDAALYAPKALQTTIAAAVRHLKTEVLPSPAGGDPASAGAGPSGSGRGAGGVAASTTRVAVSAPTKREVRGVQLNMDGLLGRRDQEDEYIKALLMVEGVTSVTIDRTRSLAIVYTYEEREMKSRLYDVVQTVCDRLRDSAGLRRISVRKADHATYLDDDEEEEEEDEDFFEEGTRKIVAMRAGGAAGGAGGKTAEERMRERDGNASAAPASGGGLLGWLGLW